MYKTSTKNLKALSFKLFLLGFIILLTSLFFYKEPGMSHKPQQTLNDILENLEKNKDEIINFRDRTRAVLNHRKQEKEDSEKRMRRNIGISNILEDQLIEI